MVNGAVFNIVIILYRDNMANQVDQLSFRVHVVEDLFLHHLKTVECKVSG
jgi:hypothetical protein